MSDLLHFAEHRLQEAALAFMGTVYLIRILWILRHKAGKEKQASTGAPNSTRFKGVIYSWAHIAMPWVMESTRKKISLYLQFALFHLGVAAAIIMSFLIPYAPGVMGNAAVMRLIQFLTGAAFIIGCYRIYRRVSKPVMRAISAPDDYFSLILLTVWFLFAFFAAPARPAEGETVLLIYFFMTAFFLVYVPFSKISHYLYYPFSRYYLGKTLGYRGVYPIKRGPKPGQPSRA